MQVIISLILVLILAIIGYSIYNRETLNALNNFNTVKKETSIFNGIMDFRTSGEIIYNTTDKSSGSYVNLTPSINQNGGAEYSYNFWIYVDKSKLVNNVQSEDVTLFLRGSKNKIHYKNRQNCQLSKPGDTYVLIKNPLVRMKADGTSIIVEYNTLTNPDAYHDGGHDDINCSSSWFDKNKGLLGIYNMDTTYDKKWFMVTIVLQEISPDNDILYKNRTSCKMYINGIVMLDRIVESPYNGTVDGSAAMRHNKGPLYVAPKGIFSSSATGTTTIDDVVGVDHALMMADLSYYNYSIESVDVEALYKKGFTKGSAKMPSVQDDDPSLYVMSPAISKGNNLPKPF